MKRTFNCISESIGVATRSKKPKLHEPLTFSRPREQLVSATSLYNYMLKDSLVDYLKATKSTKSTKPINKPINTTPILTNVSQLPEDSPKSLTEFLFKRGVSFEDEIITLINTSRIPVVSVSSYIDKKSLMKTKELMKEGVPLIHSAPVKNNLNKTVGIIDLLIRSDYLNTLTGTQVLNDEEQFTPSPLLDKPYHYVVLDIKFSTIPLRADGIHILNSMSYPAYKAQCLIYTDAIGLIQGYTAPYAFIVGRRWNYTKNGINHNSNSFLSRVGRISYNTVDSEYKETTKKAVEWVKDVRKNAKKWSLTSPLREELYPNMSADSGEWNYAKQELANEIGEMTSIWNVGVKNRNAAIKKGITSWRDDKCTAKSMDIHGTRAPVIDAILNINRQTEDLIRPAKIQSNLGDWRDGKNEVYVDFETFSDIFSEERNTDMIFMIGVGWFKNGEWNYSSFICKSANYTEELRIITEFVNFVSEMNFPRLVYWSAEDRFWKAALNRQCQHLLEPNTMEKIKTINSSWFDLLKLFQTEPIVINGCFNYRLKSVAAAMRKHKMITVCMESDCNNGMTAMLDAWKVYQTIDQPDKSSIMQDICKYNEFDVKVLGEMISYLRNNH